MQLQGVGICDMSIQIEHFLRLADIARLLSTCRTLRYDSKMATRVLASHPHSQQLFHEPGRQDLVTEQCALQLTSAMGFVDKYLLPWSHQSIAVGVNEVHELRAFVQLPPPRPPLRRSNCELPNEPAPGSSFSMHWNNLQVASPFSDVTTCACCDALQPAVHEYRQTVALLYRKWLVTAAASRRKWRKSGAFSNRQMDTMAVQMYHEMTPCDGFFSKKMAAKQDHELMAYICQYSDMSHAFSASQDEDEDIGECNWTAVYDPSMRVRCRELLQPYREAVEKNHMEAKVTRAPTPWWWRSQEQPNGGGGVECELVSGLTPSGVVVGFYYAVKSWNSPSP